MSEACKTCRFFRIESHPYIGDVNIGRCRRRAPTSLSGVLWPEVHPSDWCGEHRPADEARPAYFDMDGNRV